MTSLIRLFAAALLLAACGGESNDAEGVAEGEKRIKLSDTEDMGEMQVGTPVGWPKGDTGFIGIGTGFSVSYRDQPLSLDAAERFTDGTGCMTLYGAFQGAMKACNLKVNKGYRSTFNLAALRVEWDPSSSTSTLAVDFGPKPTLTVKRLGAPGEDDTLLWREGLQLSQYGQSVVSQRGALVLPGKYSAEYGVSALQPKQFTLTQGKSLTVATKPADKRARVIIKPPVRELPTMGREQCLGENGTFVIHRSDSVRTQMFEPDAQHLGWADRGTASGNGIQEWRAVPASGLELTMFPLAAADGSHYELVVSNLVVPIKLQAGQTKTIALERLDVDHVTITRENGSVYTATGRYVVERDDGGTWVMLHQQRSQQYGSCMRSGDAVQWAGTTGTGIDVPAGKYRVTVTYSTGEGEKEKVQVVTLP